jgi:cytochrome b translational activator protein CBS2
MDARPAEETSRDEQAGIQDSPATPAEQETPAEPQKEPEELDRIRSKVALWDSEERKVDTRPRLGVDIPLFKPSDQIHVMGLDLTGRYIAHTLAGCQTIPPIRYMLHRHYLYKQWKETDKQLTLYRGDMSIVRRRVIAEYMSREDAEDEIGDVVDNLIVTLPASQVLQAIGDIKHRLDHRSTICLVNDGLGVAEALIEAYFPDESRRPIFILGHFTTSLGHTDTRFSVSEVRPGRLYLSLFSPQGQEANQRFRIKRHPPFERTARGMHFIRLLTAMPGLNATGHPMPDFLRYKLPTVAFRTIVDPLAALFDCRYDYLPTNAYARQLMDRLVGELTRVVSLLPECRDSQKFRQFAYSPRLREEVFHKLMRQRTADSKMRAQLGRGWDTDVEFLSGYFVRRGREVQATVTTLDAVMWAVKAKQAVVVEKLAGHIPFEKEE